MLTLTAQLFPVAGGTDGADLASAGTVQLEVSSEEGRWYALGLSPVVIPGFTASFRVENWPDDRDVPYRLSLLTTEGLPREEAALPFEGHIRAEPIDGAFEMKASIHLRASSYLSMSAETYAISQYA